MIILTGASGGIGKEIIKNLGSLDQVLGLYNSTKPPASKDKNIKYQKINLANTKAVKEFVKKNKRRLSQITLIHCAALKIDGLAANYKEADWDKMMQVNLKANFLLTQGLLPIMIEERWGRIIHISSVGAVQGDLGTLAYSTVKSGLIGMSRVLAKEYARFNITSNIIALGNFKTGLFNRLKEAEKKKILERVPCCACGDCKDISNAIDFLIKSEYVNGSVINIDGGI